MRDECYTCKREISHGGKCFGKDGAIPCLAFDRDPRGRRKYLRDASFKVPLGLEIPEIKKPCDYYTLNGVSKTITFTRIHKVEWHKDSRGLRGIRIMADVWYWSHENGELPPSKPKLRLVKTGGKENASD